MRDDRAALNAAFAQHVARVAGLAAAYHPAPQCPQGHRQYTRLPQERAIGVLCGRCLEAAFARDAAAGLTSAWTWWDTVRAHNHDPAWHPEWRIPPGDPLDFCGSLDRTIRALGQLGLRWEVVGTLVGVWTGRTERPAITQYVDPDADWTDPATYATALVVASLQLLGEGQEAKADADT